MWNGFQWPSNWSIILMKGPAGCILLVWSHDLQAIDVWYIFELHALWTVDSVLYSYVRCYTNDLYHRNWSCPSIRRCYLLMLWTYGTCHRILMEILGILQLSIASFHKWWWQFLWSTQFPQKALCKFVTVTATQLFIYACAELRSVVFDPQKTRNKFDIWIVCVCVCDISKDRAGLVRALHCFNKHCGQP